MPASIFRTHLTQPNVIALSHLSGLSLLYASAETKYIISDTRKYTRVDKETKLQFSLVIGDIARTTLPMLLLAINPVRKPEAKSNITP